MDFENKLLLKRTLYGGLGGIVILAGIRYRSSIQKKINQYRNESLVFGRVWMVRDKANMANKAVANWNICQLNPSFCEKYDPDWRFISLGDYLSSLRPGMLPERWEQEDLPAWVQNEIEAGLVSSLIKVLGPNMGRAVLPMLGFGPLPTVLEPIAANLAARIKPKPTAEGELEPDRALLPLTLLNVLALTDANATRVFNKRQRQEHESTESENDKDDNDFGGDELSSIQKMKQGEYGEDLSFSGTFLNSDKLLVPNPFVISRDWEPAIRGMEELIVAEREHDNEDTADEEKGLLRTAYDPYGRDLPEPVPVDDKLLPGLHKGWGNAKCTHTNREILQNRLLSVLLNRLGANYYDQIVAQDGSMETKSPFVVQMDDTTTDSISRPSEFLQRLVDSGHDVSVRVTAQATTFGIALCVKEEEEEDKNRGDVTWTNIPLACFLGSGFEDVNAIPAPACLPHSGLDMDISGPLFGARQKCSIQHYMSIGGMCGWHSNHNPHVPWLQSISCGPVLSGKETVKAIRLAALYGVMLNGIGTEMDLPFGGYGLTGVCNDTAAVMEHSLHGSTQIYPLTSVGRFSMHSMRYARNMKHQLQQRKENKHEVAALTTIINSIQSLRSDLHASPENVQNAGLRMIHCLPPDMPFKLMSQSKEVMESIMREEK